MAQSPSDVVPEAATSSPAQNVTRDYVLKVLGNQPVYASQDSSGNILAYRIAAVSATVDTITWFIRQSLIPYPGIGAYQLEVHKLEDKFFTSKIVVKNANGPIQEITYWVER